MLVFVASPSAVQAQQAPDSVLGPQTVSNRAQSTLPLPFHGGPLVTGFNVWMGSSFAVRTAATNEKFDGHFRMLGMQFSRSLFVLGGAQFSWLIEVFPVLTGTVGAPPARVPTLTNNPDAYGDPTRYARYTLHSVYGVGIAPLSAQVLKPFSNRFATLLSATSGVALFNKVVPYGKATEANFTASGSMGVEFTATPTVGVAAGYTLHHVSNASLGASNPGMNSHMLFVRMSKSLRH